MEGQQGLQCVKGEIHNVLSVLRLSMRIAKESSGFYGFSFSLDQPAEGSPDKELVRSFKDLYEQLGFYSDLIDVDTRVFLKPFLLTIESAHANAFVTRSALHSVHKFLLYGLVTPSSNGVAEALGRIAHCTINFQFKKQTTGGIGGEAEEVLLMKVIEVLLECVRCPAGHLLSNDTICDMFDLCVAIRADRSSTPLLCQYADNILTQFTLIVFSHLDSDELYENDQGADDSEGSKPFGILATCRILQYLADMINPDDYRNDKEIREMGLRLINIALETSGVRVGQHVALREVVQDQICKQLLQNSQTVHPFILSLTLRIFFNLFSTVKEHLKVQLEVFFTSIHLRIAESSSSAFEQKQLVLESLVEFCHEHSLIVGLYRNYDCEISSTNLFEDLCKFLSVQALPVSHSSNMEVNSLHTLALEAILAVIDSLLKRFGDPYAEEDYAVTSDDELVESSELKKEKKKIAQGVQKFNLEGPKSFRFLQSIGLLDDPLSAESVSYFFRTAPLLDRYLVGAYLGMPQDFNQQVLQSYLQSFDMAGLRIDEALRVFLESFVLPGEAQIIERIMECFAKKYYECNSENSAIASEDSAFILSYSIIMLNTDAHNPQVHHKMSLESWLKNNRGINDGGNFPDEFLVDIFYSISEHSIRIQSESIEDVLGQDGSGVSAKEWKRLIAKSRQVGSFKTSAVHEQGQHMFSLIATTSVHVLDFYMQRSKSSKLLQRIIEGYHAFSRICSVYEMTQTFNSLIIPLCNSLCTLLQNSSVEFDGYGPLASFGRNLRAQRITTLLFNLILGHGQVHLVEAWPNVIHCLLWLSELGMLPRSLVKMEDFRDKNGNLFVSRNVPEYIETPPTLEELSEELVSAPTENQSSGTLSYLFGFISLEDEDGLDKDSFPEGYIQDTSDLSYENDDDNTLSISVDEDIEYLRLGRECIQSCQMDSLFTNSTFSDESLDQLVQTLVFISTYSSGLIHHNAPPVSMGIFSDEVISEKSAVFCMERICDVVESNTSRLDIYWEVLNNHFEYVLSNIEDKPSFYLERIIVNLLRLSVYLASSHHESLEDVLELLLKLLNLSSETFEAYSDRIAAGMQLMIQTGSKSITFYEGWSSIFSLFKRLLCTESGKVITFETIEFIINNHVVMSNYLVCFQTLSELISSQTTVSDPYRLLGTLVLLYSRIKNLISRNNRHRKSDESGSISETMSLKELWLCSVQGFCMLCNDPRLEIRIRAIDCLHKALISSGVSIKSHILWKIAFESLLIPVLTNSEESEESEESDDEDQEQQEVSPHLPLIEDFDVRIKICNLLVHVFLENISVLVKIPDFHMFWLFFLGSLERYMTVRSDSNGKLSFHFIESMRNVLIVMKSDGILEQVRLETDQDLLEVTFSVIDSFRPDIKLELEKSLSL